MYKSIIALVLLLSAASCVFAQNQVRPEPYGQWLMYFGDNEITNRIGLHSELQLRDYFLENNIEQLLTRWGINYYADSSVMFTGGYGYIHTDPATQKIIGNSTREHRIWQQVILRHKTRAAYFEHRYRLEQRFIENKSENRKFYDDRTRYRLQVIFPFSTFSQHLSNCFFAVYDEVFINLGRADPAEYFDRNRLYFAFGYRVHSDLNFQLGYLNQVIRVPGHGNPEINHKLQVGVFYNINNLFGLIGETR